MRGGGDAAGRPERAPGPRESPEVAAPGGVPEPGDVPAPGGALSPSWPGSVRDGAPAGHGTPAGPAAPAASRWCRLAVLVPAVAALVVAAFTVVSFLRGGDAGHRAETAAVTAPAAGPVQVRAVHSGLCLGERPGRRGGPVYQAPCAGTAVPRHSLVPLDGGLWGLRSDRPGSAPGCPGAPAGAVERDGTPLTDLACGERGADPAYRIEAPTGAAPTGAAPGYRIRSARSGLCLEVRDGAAGPWTEVVHRACDDAGAGQLFSFDRRRG
ncbi:RICIN domain-containing protein [Streptomyces lavendulocolor]|uniref:RICIN domain-containing protein n=1 Tax=Streptomyces lavendulocolor TaxID=67316 RepID=UPI003C2DB06E